MKKQLPKLYILFVGDSRVGKISLLQRMTKNIFVESETHIFGLDYYTKVCACHEENYKVYLYDTAWQDELTKSLGNYFKKFDVACICFCLGEIANLNRLKQTVDSLKKNKFKGKIVMIGCKQDLMREDNKIDISAFAKQNDWQYLQTSSKSGKGIHQGVPDYPIVNNKQLKIQSCIKNRVVEFGKCQKLEEMLSMNGALTIYQIINSYLYNYDESSINYLILIQQMVGNDHLNLIINSPKQATMSEAPQIILKMVFIGDSGVGKTSILRRQTENVFSQEHLATIGVDFKIKTYSVGKVKAKVQWWDTAGQERFRSIQKPYYKNASAICLCFSLNDRKSFQNLSHWLDQIVNFDVKGIVYLIGCKSDLDKEVPTDQILIFAEAHKISYIQTSAKQNTGVSDGFKKIVDEAAQNKLISLAFDPVKQVKPIIAPGIKPQKKIGCSGC